MPNVPAMNNKMEIISRIGDYPHDFLKSKCVMCMLECELFHKLNGYP